MSLKILIADDEEMLTGILVRLLKANGFPDVFAVSRPEVAIE